jgi:hypothetical protein
MSRAICVSTFLSKWCSSRGIFFDETAAVIKQSTTFNSTSSSETSNLAIFAARDLEIGELFSIIPQHATLQASQLSMFSIDGNPRQDSSILPQAVRSIVRGSDVEHPWWELAVLVALHKTVPNEILGSDECLIREEKPVDSNSTATSNKTTTKDKIILPDFSDYLNFLPSQSPQELLALNENLMKQMPATVKKDFEFNRSQNLIKSSRLRRDIPLFQKLFDKNKVLVTPQDILWSYEMVSSRANNFSFKRCSPELRPYGLYPTPIFGQEPTLCSVFDMMNHIKETNVLVADTLIHNGNTDNSEQDQNDQESNSASSLAPLRQDSFTPSIVLGALRPIKQGEEIGYAYHATPDVASNFARWGFSPNTTGI